MGIMQGPHYRLLPARRCRVAGRTVTLTTCHCRSPGRTPQQGDQVDGYIEDFMRRRLREEPDGIKIWATGGGIWRWDSSRLQLFCTESRQLRRVRTGRRFPLVLLLQ